MSRDGCTHADEFWGFFSQFGEVKEHVVIRDHFTGGSRGFGFVTFHTEKAVDDLLGMGNKLDFAGAQVEIKRAEPKVAPPPSENYDGFGGAISGYGTGVFGCYGAAYSGGGNAVPYGCYSTCLRWKPQRKVKQSILSSAGVPVSGGTLL